MSDVIKTKDLGWDDSLPPYLQVTWVNLLGEIVRMPEFVFWRSAKPIGAVGQPKIVAYWDGADPAYPWNVYLG